MGAEETLMPLRSVTALLKSIVDYAGLFPPAALTMREAVQNLAEYSSGSDAWMLARFIVPATRLDEFESAASALFPKDSSPWRLSALCGANLHDDINAISAFNSRNIGAIVDTVEVKAARVEEILAFASLVPRSLEVFVEIPIRPNPVSLVQAMVSSGLRAKVRTGGVTADAFPLSADLARFIRACVDDGVQFKATAGLHHPMRAIYNLTYKPDSEKGKMYGYLNVFLASAFMKNGMTNDEAVQVLEEESQEAFRFDDDGISWRTRRLSVQQVQRARSDVAVSFGSCSFREPVGDLKNMHLV